MILDISHDKVTRFLANNDFNSKTLWYLTKKIVRKIESLSGVLIFDDTLLEKEHTDTNTIVGKYYDHSKNRFINGVDIVSCMYSNGRYSIPIAFEIYKKQEKKPGVKIRTKNDMLVDMLWIAKRNNIVYRYVLADSWFAASKTMKIIENELKKYFIFPIKRDRQVTFSLSDRKQNIFSRVDELEMKADTVQTAYLKGVDFPVLLIKKVLKNKDGSQGIQYLVSNDMKLTSEQMWDEYSKRWKIEEYHKSLKQNTALGKSPTRTERTQSNHFFASIYAQVKLEVMKMKSNLNHFALRSRIYMQALREAYKIVNRKLRFA